MGPLLSSEGISGLEAPCTAGIGCGCGAQGRIRKWVAGKSGHPHNVIEAALAHLVQDKLESACPSERR